MVDHAGSIVPPDSVDQIADYSFATTHSNHCSASLCQPLVDRLNSCWFRNSKCLTAWVRNGDSVHVSILAFRVCPSLKVLVKVFGSIAQSQLKM